MSLTPYMEHAGQPNGQPPKTTWTSDQRVSIKRRGVHHIRKATTWHSRAMGKLKWESIVMKNTSCMNPSPWEAEPARRLRHNLTRNNTKNPTHEYLTQLLQRGIKNSPK